MATRPADVRIDDLASPRFPVDVEAIRSAMTAMGADLHLEPDELLASAAEQTGLDNFGDPRFREPLAVLCAALRTEAGRQVALGRVLVAEGDATAAAHELRAAIRGWRDVGSPYEVARARAVLSRALRAVNDDDNADLELGAALDEFRRLGARTDIEAAERELRDAEDRRSGPATAHKTFMFTDIVGSTTLAEALGDRAWERLLRWHDDVLRSQVASGGGEIVNSTGDGFFAAFESARAGIDCAIAIQRALVEHRESTGFALSVRIGLHTAEANRRGNDYSGKGVHVAARVAALAQGAEILATAETIAKAGTVATSDPRATPIKGVAEPVQIATVAWT